MATWVADGSSGSEANAGTSGAPKLYIKSAVALASPGDTVYIKGGTYNHNNHRIDSQDFTVPSGTIGAHITIAPYPGETVTIMPPNGKEGIRYDTNAVSYVDILGGSSSSRRLIIDQSNQTIVGGAAPLAVGCRSNSHHNLFEYLEVKNSTGDGVGCGRNGAQSYNNTFRGLYIHDFGVISSVNSGYGMYFAYCHDCIIEDCIITGCVGYGIHMYSGSGNSHDNDSNIIRRNFIHGNGTGGGTNFGIIYANGQYGYVYQNVIYSNGGGIQVYSGALDCALVNNTIYANTNQGIEQQYYASAPLIENNICKGNSQDYRDSGGTGSPAPTNNLFYNTNVSGNLYNVDPLWVNPGAADFRLQAGSPCIDYGVTIYDYTTDVVGNTISGAYDIGAYEFFNTGASVFNADGVATVSFTSAAQWASLFASAGVSTVSLVSAYTGGGTAVAPARLALEADYTARLSLSASNEGSD